MMHTTIQDILNHKKCSVDDLLKDIDNLNNFDANENTNNFYGNKFLYHYQLENLLKCKRIDTNKTIFDIFNDEKEYNKLIKNTLKRNRCGKSFASDVFECFRVNLGSVVMFKPTTAKYLYKKYSAKNVFPV